MTRTLAALTPALLLTLYAPSSPAQGLEPPPPMAPGAAGSPPPSSSGQLPSSPGPTNADDENQDSGLGLEWVWINADVGFSSVNMSSFSESQLGLVQTSGSGPTFGVGAGVRLFFLTAGVRVRDSLLSSLGSLWEIDAEAALHMRVWHIDPYFGVRGGYAFVGSLSSSSVGTAAGVSPPDVSINGFNVGPILGIDLYLSHLVSIGVEGDAEFLFLNRPKADISKLPPDVQAQVQSNPLYQASGSSVGLAAGATAHLGIHF
jgi:hypothetical protein